MNHLVAALYILIIVSLVGFQVRYIQLEQEYSRWGIFITIVMTVSFAFVVLELVSLEIWAVIAGGFAVGFLSKMFFQDLMNSQAERRAAFEMRRRAINDIINQNREQY